MKVIIFFCIILLGVLLGMNSLSQPSEIKNGRCYILLKSSYQSDDGMEYVDSVINLSFSGSRGSVTINTALITAKNESIPLAQSMDFTLSSIYHNEYTISIVKVMNKSIVNSIPKNISPYIRNILDIYLISPTEIKFRMVILKEGGYMIYINLIPWAYCNAI